jgi:ATP-dependent RNA helicase DeaD
MLVLDDADRMLKMGLRPDVEQILVRTPSTRQTALFSAGLPDPIRAMISRYLRNPIWVTTEVAELETSSGRRGQRTAVS